MMHAVRRIERRERTWRQWNVAVTGVNAHAENPGPGLAVCRSIVEHPEFMGRVIALGYDALDAGLYARDVCSSSYLLPYPSSGNDALLERLAYIKNREGLDAIIPCLDSELQNFIALRPELERMGIRILVPRRSEFHARAKDRLADLCKSIGISTPETKVLTNPAFFDTCESNGWKYPLVVKGIFYDAAIVGSAAEAKLVFNRLVSKWGYPCLVQKVIYGDELNLSAVGDGCGIMLGAVSMRKRAVTEKGKAWAGVTIVDNALTEVSEKLIKALNWRGPLEVEAIRTPDGKINLIEINPRFPSWIYLSQSVGRNLPVLVLKILDRDADLSIAPMKPGTFFIRYAKELIVDLSDFESVMVTGCLEDVDVGMNTQTA